MEGWFTVAEQFHTQADPAFCGLGSLVVALNALGVDPQRLWKGPWRWFSEELLDCCLSLDQVRARGVTLAELSCLARCNGVDTLTRYASDADEEALRSDITLAARASSAVLIASYSRKALGQSGGGHFSPVAGLHSGRDCALLLDVARFKYPPHWVSVKRLHHAMLDRDPDSGRSRGWMLLRRREKTGGLLLSLTCAAAPWRAVVDAFDAPRRRWRDAAPSSLDDAFALLVESLDGVAPYVEWRVPVDAVHAEKSSRLKSALVASPVGIGLASCAGERVALAAAVAYALSRADIDALPFHVAESLLALVDLSRVDTELRAELERLREQVATLRENTEAAG